MDTTFLQLSFLVQNNPGVYSLLLGAGISYSSGIPTAWDVVLDLIRKLAEAQGENELADPAKWYQDRFGKAAGYSDLLQALAPTQLERNRIIQPYFEPTADERETGQKLPTAAHKAIAALIRDGYIRVVLTTNFDRLLEAALAEIGITPDIISSAEMAEGALPPEHSKITIVKLHGDYRDWRTMNTSEELQDYNPAINKLLDRIFDNYGLIVCGWSATWDTALRKVFHRVANRRFSTYWVDPYSLSDEGKQIVQVRGAQLINMTADQFFNDLAGTVDALAKSNREHPLSITVAVERTKKLIANPLARIELADLLSNEVERASATFMSDAYFERLMTASTSITAPEELWERFFKPYFEASELVLNMMATLCWFGDKSQSHHVTAAINRWAEEISRPRQTSITWHYSPALFLLYVAGVAAIQNQNWTYLPSILTTPKVRLVDRDNKYAFVLSVVGEDLLLAFMQNLNPRNTRVYVSTYLENHLYSVMKHYFTRRVYENAFDLYEMVLALVYLDTIDETWMPPHALIWTNRSHSYLSDFWSGELSLQLVKQAELFNKTPKRLYDILVIYQRLAAAYKKPHPFADGLPDFATLFGKAHKQI